MFGTVWAQPSAAAAAIAMSRSRWPRGHAGPSAASATVRDSRSSCGLAAGHTVTQQGHAGSIVQGSDPGHGRPAVTTRIEAAWCRSSPDRAQAPREMCLRPSARRQDPSPRAHRLLGSTGGGGPGLGSPGHCAAQKLEKRHDPKTRVATAAPSLAGQSRSDHV